MTYLLTLLCTYEAQRRKAIDFISLTLTVLYGSSYVLSKHPLHPNRDAAENSGLDHTKVKMLMFKNVNK